MQVVLLLAIIGTALAVPRNIQRIVGGEETTADKYPFIANMQFQLFGSLYVPSCGGSLINENWVLSGAQCYREDSASQWRVRLGTSYAQSGGDVHSVKTIIVHANYDSYTLENDIALLELTSFANMNNVNIAAARIPGPNYILRDDEPLNIVGWGSTEYSATGDSEFSEQLRHVGVRSINQKTCVERYTHLKSLPNYSNIPDVTENMFCTGIIDVGGKDACQGDSGGPVVHAETIIVGVVSWSHECADATYPGVKTRVAAYSDWILDNAK